MGKAGGEGDQGQVGVSEATGPGYVQPVVQLQLNVLGEATWADTALEGPGSRVQAQVGLEVAGAAEALVAHLAGMGTGHQACPQVGSGLSPSPS